MVEIYLGSLCGQMLEMGRYNVNKEEAFQIDLKSFSSADEKLGIVQGFCKRCLIASQDLAKHVSQDS